jgi:transcriptional regulator with XRE-family HTH domain
MINRIRVLRAETKTSQTVLGRRSRMSQTMLNHVENGKREPTPAEQKRIAKALRVSVERVFPPQPDVDDDPPPRRKLTRNERKEAQADAGYDTLDWEEQ